MKKLISKEHHKKNSQWKQTYKGYQHNKTLHHLFEEQTAKTPDDIALICESLQLTYRELNEKSNQLAHHIRAEYHTKNQTPLAVGMPIALCLDRSPEMIIAILAVLKCGGAYVPIDPEYPQERIDWILADTAAEFILIKKHHQSGRTISLPESKTICVNLTEALYDNVLHTSDFSLQHIGTDLAYIIYTSGTTGKSKGVLIEHHSVINLVNFHNRRYSQLSEKKLAIALVSNYNFDFSVQQIFSSILYGHALHIISKELILNPKAFNHYLLSNKIEVFEMTPTLFSHLILPFNNYQRSQLKLINIGGENLPVSLVAEFFKKELPSSLSMINTYGPTECTVDASSYEIDYKRDIKDSKKPIPIGKPIDNTQLYVLDQHLELLPVGVIGELYIGGAGLSRGYLNRPDLTAERFIPNPFASKTDKAKGYTRLYKTGDLVKWLPDGNIEYLSRNDDQVKVRGFRVEPAEIEQAMLQVPAIQQACVLVKEVQTEIATNQYLVGYYTLKSSEEKITQTQILETISNVLPDYMVPSALVFMASFPQTINGKLDKRAFPDPSFTLSADEYEAPSTDTEIALCRIWQEILGLPRVGITDNFFKFGGNSILAIQASHRMSLALGYDIKVSDLFRYNDISHLLLHTSTHVQFTIPVVDTRYSFLSYSQERLWFIEQYEEGTNAYHLPEVYEFDSSVNIDAVRYALQQIVSRHEVLRSTIEQDPALNQGIQVVHQEPLAIEDISLESGDDYHTLLKTEINRPFDLSKEYPIRARFYYIPSADASEQKTILLINMHHIASDGWSTDLFEQELSACYEAYVKGDSEFKLPALEIQYKDYALWQRSYLSGELLDKQLSYWTEKLAGYQTLEFPTDYARPGKIDYRGAQQEFILNKALSTKLKALAQTHGLTLNTVLLSAMSILLGKYTGQDDIIIGSLIANRHHRQTEDLIGFFVNTQANRMFLSPNQSFEELLLKVHQEQIDAQLHQDLPFEKLVDALNVERDTSRHPVFQILFGVQSFGTEKNYLKTFQLKNSHAVSQFDATVFIDDSTEALSGQISYATSLFRKERMEKFARHYTYLLEQLSAAPEKAYANFGLLDAEEYQQVIHDWNATEQAYPKDKTIHRLFEEQVERTADHIALVFEGQALSYRQLNEKSNQLAHQIREEYQRRTNKELRPDTLIALCLDRSLEMVIGILAVLKAGGAYVPIDPNYPQERIDWMLEDTGTMMILSLRSQEEQLNHKLPAEQVMYIDLAEEFYKKEECKNNLLVISHPEDLAYVLYTSGTTGKPKGVMIEHFSLCNRIVYMIAHSEITELDYYVFKTNYVFDVSFSDIFAHLCAGAKLHITKHLFDIDELSELLASRRFTSLHLVPSQYELIASAIRSAGLEKLYFSGEALTEKIIHDLDNNIKIYNYYGPTETGEITLHRPLLSSEAPVIGKLFPNSTHYVLSSNLTPVPEGIIGELYIGGDGLARGYLNREDLTNERFIPNPFATEADKAKGHTRLYKTGDLVRFLQNGALHYVGRNDGQVKINGFRIELAEIEHALLNIPGIRQACILAKERKSKTGTIKYLAAWYTLDPQHPLQDQAFLESRLSEVLPEHMIPASFIEVESFPLTVNGKLDKRALPEPDFNAEVTYIKPETELETELCHIYSDILGLAFEQVSTHQNFFKIGGNSILSIKLKQRLNQVAEFKHISVADLFKYNSITKLIQSIQKETSINYHLQKDPFHTGNHEIAIIGMSGAFSGADNVEEFWKLISHQKEGTRFYDKDECLHLQVDDSLLINPDYIPVLGTVKGIDQFDPLFWDISPNEAKQLDPQIRKFLEHCWQVLETSGYIRQRKEQHTGIFAGNGNSTYFHEHILNGEMAEQINFWEASASNSKDALATKVAFLLGLTGPANSVNTGCSTGLVTVVEACQKLRLGICNLALAGGVSLAFPDQIGYVYQEGMIYSKDGHCRTFDKDSSGTTGGSGVGVVLLKRLDDAVRDKDNILAVIKGYATNNDGDRKTGYTAPSVIGQSECILNAQKMAGVYSNQIDYVECHGTATHLGDPIEVQALKEAFEYNRKKETTSTSKTILGAVKANIGHTDAAAGVAGLIKVCAMLKHGIIPGQVNFNEPNPELNLQDTCFDIVKENRAWLTHSQKQRLAGVSSFGVGGTNAHIIVGDYQEQENLNAENPLAVVVDEAIQYIIPLSAKSRLSLENYKKALLDFIEKQADTKANHAVHIRDIAYSMQEKKEHFNYRTAYCVSSTEELSSQLKLHTPCVQRHAQSHPKIVFMFPGQGSQYPNMAKELYHQEQAFRNVVDQCIQMANRYLETDLFEVMYPSEESALITETQWAQISLFIIEYAFSKFLNTLGIREDAYIGHSIGEYVAATLSGVFSLEDAIKLVIKRGQLMQEMKPGAMLSVNTEHPAAMPIIEDSACEIAVINTQEDVVVSGSIDAIRELKEKLDQDNIFSVRLNTSHAYHSKMMEKAANEFENYFHTVRLNKPNRYFISNLTGEMATEEVLSATYWSNQLRHKVQFYKGIHTICTHFNNRLTFIEAGAGKSLSSFVKKYQAAKNIKSLETVYLLPNEKEARQNDRLLSRSSCKEDLLAKLWEHGVIEKPNKTKLFKQAKPQWDIPVYQFDSQKYWLEKGSGKKNKTMNPVNDMFYHRTWERIQSAQVADQTFRHQHVLVMVQKHAEDPVNSDNFVETLSHYFDHVSYCFHQPQLKAETGLAVDFGNASQLNAFFDRKTAAKPFDMLIYLSSSINLSDPGIDIFAIRNVFEWAKHKSESLKKIVSVSFDHYDVTGYEDLIQKPSLVYGVTKSIPFEYFTSNTVAFHVDLDSKDSNYGDSLISVLAQSPAYSLLAIRGKHSWSPVYKKFTPPSVRIPEKHAVQDGSVVLITGGLGAVGYAYAKHIARKFTGCTFIITGRSTEEQLRPDYKERLENLRNTRHRIIYASMDLGAETSTAMLAKILADRHIGSIALVLHAAGVAAKSALNEKSHEEIMAVVKPKVNGVEHLIRLSATIPIGYLVCCSSEASILPSLGNMEYTAANLYLDEVSYRSYSNIKKILSINLTQVSDTGMAIDFIKGLTTKHELSLNSITSDEFPPIMEKLLYDADCNSVCLSRYDLNLEFNENKELKDNSPDESTGKKEVKVIESGYTENEYQIAKIFSEVLGIEEVSLHDDFFKLGGNSILAIRLSHRISQVLQCPVNVSDVFKNKTISNLKAIALTDSIDKTVNIEEWTI